MNIALQIDTKPIMDAVLDVVQTVDDDETKLEINQLFADLADPYIPYRTGALANNVEVTPQGVIYKQPYAEEVYEQDVPHNPTIHPLATDHWGEAMLRDRADEFNQGIAQIVVRKINERG